MRLAAYILRPGEVLFREGEAGRSLFILIDGAVEILQFGRQIAVVEEPGSFIGEMSSLLNEPRNATVRALEPTFLNEVEAIDQFFEMEPRLTHRMAYFLASRLQSMNLKVRQLEDQLDGWDLAEKSGGKLQTARQLLPALNAMDVFI